MTTLASDTWTGSNGDPWGSTWTTGLTPAGGGATIQSNAGRLTCGTAGGYSGADRVARRVDITAPTDAVALFKFRWPGGEETFPLFYVRSTNTSLDTQGGYFVSFDFGGDSVAVGVGSSYSSTDLDTFAFSFAADTWYWCRFGVVGSALKARVWADGGSEPAAWDSEVTDTTHAGAGSGCGFTVGAGAAGGERWEVDDFTLEDVFPSTAGAVTGTLTGSATVTAVTDTAGAVAGTLTGSATATGVSESSGSATGALVGSATVTGLTVDPFPQGLLPVTVELLGVESADVWADVTPYVRYAEGIQIRRGRSGEGRQTDTTSVAMTFDNRDHRFTPRNPTGPYHGRLGRNTQGRVSVTVDAVWLALSGVSGSSVTAPDSAGLSITGDVDLRFDAWLWTWRPEGGSNILLKSSAGQRSYRVIQNGNGTTSLYWSADGTTELSITSTLTVPLPMVGRKRVRVTFDVNNGAGGKTVTFYTADPDDGTLSTATWTQWDTVTESGTTSIADTTSSLTVFTNVEAKVFAAQVRDGIAGTVRAFPDFAAQAAGVSSFSDGTNTWTVGAGAALTDADVRAWFEVAAWPRKRDVSGSDETVPIEGAGIMRRLGAGASPLNSTLRRGILSASTSGVREYWPCEDGDTATRLASAVGGPAMVMNNAAAALAAFSGFDCSLPLPTLAAATELRGAVRNHPATGFSQVRCLLAIPDTGTVDGASLLEVNYTGSAATWQIRYGTGGTLTVRAFTDAGVSLLTDGPTGFGMDDTARWVSLELTQDGADIDWAVKVLDPGETVGLTASGTVAGQTFGRPTRVTGSPGGGTDGISMGHFVVQDEITSLFDLGAELAAHVGETATARVSRLCDEEGITFRQVGGLEESAAMGPQAARSLLDLLRECEEADGGVLFEPRDGFGLAYRSRASMCSLPVSLELDHAQNQLSAPLDPVPDDQALANDVTVSRTDGSSARVEDTTGPLSTQAPPDGVGRYDTSVTLNVESDTTLDDHAGWRLHLGTVDEDRYPSIQVRLAHPEFSGDAALTADVRALDVGDRLLVTNPPAGEPPEDVDQLAQGFTERIDQKTHDIAVNTAPARPWRVLIYDDTTDAAGFRYSSDTVTAEALDTTETGVDVTVAAGQRPWAHNDGDYDIMIGGERMTVTGVSGAGLSQTFTVVRSVNGVVKSHSSGAKVELYAPFYWGL